MSKMWLPDEQTLGRMIGMGNLFQGESLVSRGRVVRCETRRGFDRVDIQASVMESELYRVSMQFMDSRSITYSCTCRAFRSTPLCRHGAAVILYYLRHPEVQPGSEIMITDDGVRKLMDRFLEAGEGMYPVLDDEEELSGADGQAQDLHLYMELDPVSLVSLKKEAEERTGSLKFAFLIQEGAGRSYLVKNPLELIRGFRNRTAVMYGKKTRIEHDASHLDARSRELLKILTAQVENDEAALQSYISHFEMNSYLSGSVMFRNEWLDRIFDLFLPDRIMGVRSGHLLYLEERDPKITLEISRGEDCANVVFPEAGQWTLFRSVNQCYLLDESRGTPWLCRIPEEAYRALSPFQGVGLQPKSIVALKDMTAFHSSVVSALGTHVNVYDPSGMLQANVPEKCTPCFYLDQRTSTAPLQCEVRFRYAEGIMECEADTFPRTRRNVMEERKTLGLMRRLMHEQSIPGRFELTDMDEIMDFLMLRLGTLRRVGEVYMTDQMLEREIHPAGLTVNMNISSGILFLDFNTGEFPAEELESLYSSLLLKRKYYRLKDGRYIRLNGSGLETLAEAVHMSQLTEEEIRQGHVELPAYRAVYLDRLFSQQDSIRQIRSSAFRDMIRRFSESQGSQFPVPDEFSGVMRNYQEIGYSWLKTLEYSHFGGILADEMGLGKTLQMIAFFHSARQEQNGRISLVVCPASLVLNWGDEFQKFAPDLDVTLILGSAAQREDMIRNSHADVFVTSYDLLKRDIAHYRQVQFYTVVLDEAQYVKNQDTLASKAVKMLQAEQRFVMTGTPIENRLGELWNLFDFIMPGYLFSQTRFREKLEGPIMESDSSQAREQLRKMVRPFILRRLKKDVLSELPPKMEFIRRIEISDEERKVYAASVAAAKAELKGESQKLMILAALTRLRQICCNPGLCYENYEGPASKLEACLQLVETMTENGHQILVFSQFASMLAVIGERLKEMQISYRIFEGSTPRGKRADMVSEFNHGGFQVFLISLKAGGTGLNLTAADVVIHYDPWWNMAAQNQATDRAHRIGQTEKVQVYKLITQGTIEEKILELQELKQNLLDSVTEANEEGILRMSAEELLELLDA